VTRVCLRSIAQALVVTTLLIAQQPPSPRTVFRVSVDLVQVDVVVTDGRGRHVDDLTADDFSISEDGKPQRITHFSFVKGPGTAVPRERGPVSLEPLRPEQVRRTVVLIADTLTMQFRNTTLVRAALNKFVDQQMQPGDFVSIMSSSGGAGVFQQFTNDKRLLHASIDRIVWSPWFEGFDPQEGQPDDPVVRTLERNTPNASRGLVQIRYDRVVTGLLATMNYAIAGLRELPGRKAIVLFSDGFQVVNPFQPTNLLRAVENTVELANRASVVIYDIDSHGLEAFSPNTFRWESADMFTQGTGGLAFRQSNGLADELGTALGDMGSYYLIGYQPNRSDFQTEAGRTPYHRIHVKVERPGVHVRSRQGFAGTPDQPVATTFQTRHEQLRHALFSPFRADGIPVHMSAFYSADPTAVAKARHTVLTAMLAIDAHGLSFEDMPDGRKKLVLDVVTAAYGASSALIAANDKTFTAEVTPREMNRLVASGLVYGIEIAIPKPGPYQVRTAVRDAASQRLGSATAFVETPDFNRPALALSSVILSDPDPARSAPLVEKGYLGAGTAVMRIFAPGADLHYDFTIFGALRRAGAEPRLEVQFRLFQGLDPVFQRGPESLPLQASTAAAIRATGMIRLPPSLPPGQYSLQVTAYDRLEKASHQAAVQWTNLTLVAPSAAN